MMTEIHNTRDFILNNHENLAYRLSMMMGNKGILLGFAGDVWDLNCVRYVLWTQRQNFKLASYGVNSALIIPNHSYELNGFFMSIPRDIAFPLLADPIQKVYEQYGMMGQTGFVLLNREGDVLNKWLVSDTSSLSLRSVLSCIIS